MSAADKIVSLEREVARLRADLSETRIQRNSLLGAMRHALRVNEERQAFAAQVRARWKP